jgi:hypothetical protein
VRDGEGGDDLTIEADGTQTMKRMRAGGVENGDSLSAGFKSCGADDMFKCKGISVGDELFTLSREAGVVFLVFGKMGAPDGTTKKIRASK